MHELIVIADPLREVEIYEITSEGKTHKISQLRLPQASVEFIKNYSESVKEKVDVTYVGPKDYVMYFVNQANKLEFVKAHANEMEDQID